jgi:hypothetical protein
LSGHDLKAFETLRKDIKAVGGVQVFPASEAHQGYAAGVWLLE